jgi:hypothetical protein
MQQQTVIFDLDGTLALIDKRRSLSTKPNGKMDWAEFFKPSNIKLDQPNIPVIKTFQALKAAGFKVGIFSGRDAITQNETLVWLSDHGIRPDFFKMRPIGSFVKDDLLKKQWLDEIVNEGHSIMCVFDDRDKVVKMWRENGITCFQVAEGAF